MRMLNGAAANVAKKAISEKENPSEPVMTTVRPAKNNIVGHSLRVKRMTLHVESVDDVRHLGQHCSEDTPYSLDTKTFSKEVM